MRRLALAALAATLVPAAPAAARTVTIDDHQKTFVLARGEQLRVVLPEVGGGTPARWETTRRSIRVLRFERAFVVPGRRVYLHRAARPGRTTIALRLRTRRGSVLRRFVLRVAVAGVVRSGSDTGVTRLRVGQRFRITVPEGQEPASHWRITAVPRRAVLRLESSEHDPPASGEGRGTRTFVWRAVGRGSTEIRLGAAGADPQRYRIRVG